MVRVYCREPVKLLASVAVTVKVAEPATVGVPERRPLVERMRPVGGLPEAREKVYGATLPVPAAVSCWLYA